MDHPCHPPQMVIGWVLVPWRWLLWIQASQAQCPICRTARIMNIPRYFISDNYHVKFTCYVIQYFFPRWEIKWPHGQYAGLWFERSWVERSWGERSLGWAVLGWVVHGLRGLGISLYCVLGQNALIPQCLFPPRSINGWFKLSGKPDEMQEVTLLLAGFLSEGEYMQ